MEEQRVMADCRMYEAQYPEIDDVVKVNVTAIDDVGANVQLLEYGNIPGMILLSELSRRRIRSVQKLIRVQRHEIALVVRVDKEKGYIDLSKRRVTPEDIDKCQEKFNKSKAVHSIMHHVAEKCGVPLYQLYVEVGWPLYKKYGHAYEAFKLAVTSPEKVFEGLTMTPEVHHQLLLNVKRRMTPQPVKIRADVEVTCFGYDGIEAVRYALQKCEDQSSEDIAIKVRLVAPPMYVITTTTTDKAKGISVLEGAIELMTQTIMASEGSVVIKMKPRAVSATDEKELAELMERVERENAEVSGDEDDEAEVGGDD